LIDLYKLFNDDNLQFQGDELNLIKTKTIIAAFVGKLLMYKRNLGRGEYSHFSNLSSVPVKKEDSLTANTWRISILISLNDSRIF